MAVTGLPQGNGPANSGTSVARPPKTVFSPGPQGDKRHGAGAGWSDADLAASGRSLMGHGKHTPKSHTVLRLSRAARGRAALV
ncbi:MAG: hypothetical protein LBP92_15815 [Deltaproteobacteria bacterium]|nr:hypothetical protein [Deltaproteobacteria bacterium]